MSKQARIISQDDRRTIRSLIADGLWEEINYVEAKPHMALGGHYHLQTKELFFIIEGEAVVNLLHAGVGSERTVVLKPMDVLMVEPMWAHTIHTYKKASWIQMLSKKHDHKNPDMHKI